MSQQEAPVALRGLREHVRLTGAGILAGSVAGLIAGIGARLVMRAMALLTDQVPELGTGTITVLGTGILLGMAGSILYVPVSKYLPGSRLWKGCAFGVLLFLVFGLLAFVLPVTVPGVHGLVDPELVGKSLFVFVFLSYGVTLAGVEERFKRSLPPPRWERAGGVNLSLVGYALLGLLGLIGLLTFVAFFLSAYFHFQLFPLV
jgi:hypothetical protein